MLNKHHLVIDQGNTTTKIGIFHHNILIESKRVNDHEWSVYFEQTQLPRSGIVATVREKLFLPKEFQILETQLLRVTNEHEFPIQIDYETPNTLGLDRIANAVGANLLFPKKNILAIDCGTCITSTFVQNGILCGGNISLGLGMRLKAIHHFTGKLPLLERTDLEGEIELIGKSTKASISSGIVIGATEEVDTLIQKYCSQFPDLVVILTGGDASFFANRLKSPIFAEPNLTLKGLNEIYIHTAH